MSIFNANTSGKPGVDTSKDTVMPDVLLEGYTAHDKNGKPITGTHTCQASVTTSFLGSFVSIAGSPTIAMTVK